MKESDFKFRTLKVDVPPPSAPEIHWGDSDFPKGVGYGSIFIKSDGSTFIKTVHGWVEQVKEIEGGCVEQSKENAVASLASVGVATAVGTLGWLIDRRNRVAKDEKK